ncbi:TrmH family RNA methyltransferase [Candidatus Saccharibacteria bacterium]|nr:TrmH family RNA methyltransferase [Candidatus Saccharibacteria bacterium]
MPKITVIAHNIRSTFNVGSIFRTCEGFGVERLILSGYTPYPDLALSREAPSCAYIDGEVCQNDQRLPHIREKITQQIHKTALGAESLVPFEYHEAPPLDELRQLGYRIAALEQAANSTNLRDYSTPDRAALLLGEEVDGIAPEWLALADDIIEIPMFGQKESFNVSVAAGIALYELAKATK